MKPEEKLGALASYLEIEYQQKTNQFDSLLVEAKRVYEPIEIFKARKDVNDKEVIRKYILKPITNLEESLLYAEEWNDKMNAKFKVFADKCDDKEYVESIKDTLDKHIVEFEYKLEFSLDILQDYKSEIFDLLGIPTTNQETV